MMDHRKQLGFSIPPGVDDFIKKTQFTCYSADAMGTVAEA